MKMESAFAEAMELLTRIIKIPSPSGKENEVADFLEKKLCQYFPDRVTRTDRNIIVDLDSKKPGGTLLLCSHIDTVEPLDTWTRDPFGAEQAGDKIYGLGANDAGASLVSLIAAARLIDVPEKGRVLLALVAEEEVGSKGFYTLEPTLPRYDAAIFGEPTDLRMATSMRGAMKAILRSRGIGCHASLPWEGKNAVDRMIKDVQKLREIDLKDSSPWGGATIEPTIVSGGKSSNQIPDLVETTLDIRTTAHKDNDWVLSELKKTGLEIEVVFNRRRPMFNDPDSRIVRAYRESFPHEAECIFNGTCDMAFSKAPSIILGPGDLKMAHVADECTRPSEIKRAIAVFHKVINRYLSL